MTEKKITNYKLMGFKSFKKHVNEMILFQELLLKNNFN